MVKLKKNSNNKGITLVVLVITIVVLLILAGVSITTLSGESGITSQAQKVADESKENVEKNLADLKELEGKLDSWREVKNEKGQVVGVEKAKQKLKIGDYIAYDCTSGEGANASYTSYSYNNRDKNNGITSGYSDDQTFKSNEYTGKWRVLGVSDNGELLIMATEDVQVEIGGTTDYRFDLGTGDTHEDCKLAYQYGVTELNNISAIYGKGNGATGARSITVEDINKITGYNPERTGDNEPYNKDKISEYGNEVTYTWKTDGNISYTSTNGTNGNLIEHSESGFYYYDEIKKEWIKSSYTTSEKEIVTIKNTRYSYYPETLTTKKDVNANTGILHNSEAYKMIFGIDGGLNRYWLGTSQVFTNSSYVLYTLQRVYNGYVIPMTITYSYDDYNCGGYGVRPVVSISTNTKLISNGENAGTEENPYILSE